MARRRFLLVSAIVALSVVFRVHAASDSQAASIAEIAPPVASYGESVTITGSGFGGANVVVRVDGVAAPLVAASGNKVTFRVPTGVPIGSRTVTATNPGGHTGSIGFDLSGDVTLALDEAHRAGAVIGAAGGTIIAQANGITYTLTIPAGALVADEAIVITPVAALTGLPLDRLLGAIHFAPEGLQFGKPAILTIGVAPTTNTRGLAGFFAAGNGENLHLVPTYTSTGEIEIVVPHFTVAGAGTGSPAAISAVSCQHPTLECTYTNQLAQAAQQAIQTACGTGCATPNDLAAHESAIEAAFEPSEVALLHEWFGKVLDMLQTTGVADDAGLTNAGRQFNAWHGWVEAYPCGGSECRDVPELAADEAQGTTALGAAYVAAFRRAHDVLCSDHRVLDLLAEVDELSLFGEGGLPDDQTATEDQFACQVVITGRLPATAHFGDNVSVDVTVGLRTGGPTGPVAPLPNIPVQLAIADGCGQIDGSTRFKIANADANGHLAVSIAISLPCTGAQNATELRISVADVNDSAGLPLAIGHSVSSRSTFPVVITLTPEDASVAAGGTVNYSAQLVGAGPLVTWSATGGTIPAGPSATATYSAGNSAGTFSVTATSVDDPSQSQTVAVTITSANPTLPFQAGHYHGGSSSPFTPGGVPADVAQTCTNHGGVVLMRRTFDYQITAGGEITGTLGIDATLTSSGPLTMTGQSGPISVQVTAYNSNQVILDLQGTSQVLGAFCGRFTLAGIQTLYIFGLDSVSIGLNLVGP